MAKRKTAAQRRFDENALLITALELVFKKLYEDYSTKFIDEIAVTTSGGTPLRNTESYYGGEIPWIKSGELNDGLITQAEEFITQEALENSSAKIFPKGTLVVALYGATVGKTGILEISAASNQAVCAVTPKTKEITSKFLFWFFRYKRPEFLGASFGGAQPNISQKIIRETIIPIPPIDLQETLSDFFSVVELKQRKHEINYPPLPENFTNTLHVIQRVEVLSGHIIKVHSLREKADIEIEAFARSFSRNVLSKIEKETKVFKTLKETGKVSTGGTPSKSNLAYWDEGDIPWVSPKDMKVDNINNTQDHISTFAIENGAANLIPENSILIVVRSGILRRTVPVAINRIPVTVNQDIKVIAPYQDVLPEYLRWWIKGNEHVLLENVKGGTTVQSLMWEKASKIKVPVPPLDEQRRIVAYLDSVQARLASLRELQSATGEELSALLPSVLDRAFKGEL